MTKNMIRTMTIPASDTRGCLLLVGLLLLGFGIAVTYTDVHVDAELGVLVMRIMLYVAGVVAVIWAFLGLGPTRLTKVDGFLKVQKRTIASFTVAKTPLADSSIALEISYDRNDYSKARARPQRVYRVMLKSNSSQSYGWLLFESHSQESAEQIRKAVSAFIVE